MSIDDKVLTEKKEIAKKKHSRLKKILYENLNLKYKYLLDGNNKSLINEIDYINEKIREVKLNDFVKKEYDTLFEKEGKEEVMKYLEKRGSKYNPKNFFSKEYKLAMNFLKTSKEK